MIARVLLIALLAACVASWAYWLIALRCLAAVLRRRPASVASFEPTVSLLKPVKGLDAGAMQNFATFCEQNYPDVEVLFGVADAADPAVPLVEQLKQRFPNRRIRLIVATRAGANPKSSILQRLAREASGQVLILSDADIRVGPDYVRRVVQPLADPAVGLSTCLYRGEAPRNLMARLAALHMDASFAPSACLGWKLGTPVGLGATMAMRAADLQRIGGFEAFADYLLDDYEAARRLSELGLRIELSDCVVASVLGPQRVWEQWHREVRWSRGIRTAHPRQYPGLAFTFSTPVALVAACLSAWWPWAWVALPASLLVRWFVGWRASRMLGQRKDGRLALLPLRDLLSAVVWLAAMLGRRIRWRGAEYELLSDGRLRPLSDPSGDAAPARFGIVARLVRWIDAALRRRERIFEFDADDRCLLRIAATRAQETIELADGTRVSPGDPLGELHLWNEHVPRIAPGGPDLRWAMALRQRMRHSLTLLARAAERDPRLADAKAFGATAVFVSRRGETMVERLIERFGFQRIESARRASMGARLHRLGENILVLGLQWTYNPDGLSGKGFFRPRERIWISRERLLRQYGPSSGAAVAIAAAAHVQPADQVCEAVESI